MIEQLFRGLLRIDHDLNVVPELAQNMNVSADGLTYLFMLREDACWSDGHPLTAGDFVYAWRKLREEGHVTAFLLDDIASAEALDDWTLEVHLREPRNYFPYVLASHWAYPWPRHRADEVGRGLAPARVARRQRAVRARRGRRDGRAPEREPALAHGLGQRRRGAHRLPRPRRRSRRSTSGWPGATTCSSCGTRRSRGRATRSRSARRRSRRRSSASTSARSRWPTSACAARSRTRSTARRWWRSRPGVDLAAGRGGAIPPVMPGPQRRRRACPYDLERGARAARRGRLSRAARACRSSSWTRGRGRPPAALAEQLAAIGVRARFEIARQALRRRAGDARLVRGLARRLPRPRRLLPRAARAGPAALPRRRDGRGAGAARASRATATSACACTASSSASGSASARRSCRISYARQLVLRRPQRAAA